ncbi:MAG: alpha/beta fold hydrolase [Pseudomonadota bacterium]
MRRCRACLLLGVFLLASCKNDEAVVPILPLPAGSLSVGSTNMEVKDDFATVTGDDMHRILIGQSVEDGPFLSDIMKYPESAWRVDVDIPGDADVYGPAAGTTMPVSLFVTYPAREDSESEPYIFPYLDSINSEFPNMLAPGETPSFADDSTRFPLIILAHGYSAHGIYDVDHAHSLSRQGYIVAVLFYGDLRTVEPDSWNPHTGFLRARMTRAVIDALLESEDFGDRIDTGNIGISGHSFGGFTALALNGGRYLDDVATVHDPRITASVIAAPWVGHTHNGDDVFAFGQQNEGLGRVSTPVLSFFGTRDTDTTAEFILPAMQRLSGPTYVVELVDQPHVFEGGSWQDRDNWELLFFNAYLKQDPDALRQLQFGESMDGGNEDRQLFDYQKLAGTAP